jgi:hypothetical protein
MQKSTVWIAMALVAIMVGMVAIPLAENVSAVPSGWNEKKLTTVSPEQTAIAVDTNGKVHVAFIDYNNSIKLCYMDDVSGAWSSVAIIDPCVGAQPALAVDSQGHSYIAYTKQNGSMMLATNAGGAWTNTTIFTNPLAASTEISMALDSNNKVYIAFCPFSYTNRIVKLATNAGGSWATENVTSGSASEVWPAVAIDSANKVHVACYSVGTTNRGLVYHENTTGTWSTTLIDATLTTTITTTVANTGLSMTFDHNGKVHIAYDNRYTAIKYVTNAGGAWVNSTLETIPVAYEGVQYMPSIVVDSSNNPSICYSNITSNFDYSVDVITKSGSSWTFTSLGQGVWPGMAISPSDKLYVSYQGWGNRSGLMLDSTGSITGGTIGASGPGPCTNVRAVGGDKQVSISWGLPVTGGSATNVRIYRSTVDSMPSNSIATVSASSGTYIDHVPGTNITGYYWLVSVNDYGTGEAVPTGKVVTDAATAPSSPSPGGYAPTGIITLLVIVVLIVVVVMVFIRRRRRGRV